MNSMRKMNGLESLTEIEILTSLGNMPVTDWGLRAIGAPDVWHKTMGEGVKIMSIDTGIDIKHPDLKYSFAYNFVDRGAEAIDDYGHGTHVAGLLVGETTGVAPKAELQVVKVLNQNGDGRISDVMDGITMAMQNNVDVLCLSLGIPNDIPLILKQRIIQAYESGITIVSAVGNDGERQAQYPAIMDEVIAVGGLDEEGNVASFSNGGYDVLAPATRILSTYKDGNYARMTGTSMASPLVAGAIALLISQYRKHGEELTPDRIMRIMYGELDLTELI